MRARTPALHESGQRPAPARGGGLRASPGFTLVELVVVTTLVILATTAVIPMFIRFHRRSQLQDAVWKTLVLAAEARGLAVSRETLVEMSFDAEAHAFRLRIEPTEAEVEGGAPTDQAPVGERLTADSRAVRVPEDIAVTVDGPAGGPVVRFYPDGRSEPATLRFEREELDPAALAMNPRTGRLRPVEEP